LCEMIRMKISMLPIVACFAFLVSSGQSKPETYDQLRNHIFTQKELQEDFIYLRKALEETHPGLYRYTTQGQMTRRMDSLYRSLTDMKFHDYYLKIASFIASIRCAHSTTQPAGDWFAKIPSYTLFPFTAILIKEKIYLYANLSDNVAIKPGFELVSINGNRADSVRNFIFNHLSSDGYIESLKRITLGGNRFMLFYNMFIGQPDSFAIVCKDLQEKEVSLTLPAVPASIVQKKYTSNPANKQLIKINAPRMKKLRKSWRLELKKDHNAAVLTIHRFDGGKTGDEAKKKMKDFMDESIKTISKNNISNLIIDLRDNSGGWDNQGQELFTYLIDKPLRYYQRFHMVTDSSEFLKLSSVSKEELANIKNILVKEQDGTYTVKEEYNSTLALQHPKPNRFTGKVYFLIDGATGSAAAEFTAVAHSNKLGTFIGDETGGNYSGGNGGEFITLYLPNTKIKVGLPLMYYENAVEKPLQEGHGTIPDHYVPYTITDILKGRDTQLEFVLNLINQAKKG
jgi:C-terminal processing protease CtpA/Prc